MNVDTRGHARGKCHACTQCSVFERNTKGTTCGYCGCTPVEHQLMGTTISSDIVPLSNVKREREYESGGHRYDYQKKSHYRRDSAPSSDNDGSESEDDGRDRKNTIKQESDERRSEGRDKKHSEDEKPKKKQKGKRKPESTKEPQSYIVLRTGPSQGVSYKYDAEKFDTEMRDPAKWLQHWNGCWHMVSATDSKKAKTLAEKEHGERNDESDYITNHGRCRHHNNDAQKFILSILKNLSKKISIEGSTKDTSWINIGHYAGFSFTDGRYLCKKCKCKGFPKCTKDGQKQCDKCLDTEGNHLGVNDEGDVPDLVQKEQHEKKAEQEQKEKKQEVPEFED